MRFTSRATCVRAALIAAVLVLVVAACGGDGAGPVISSGSPSSATAVEDATAAEPDRTEPRSLTVVTHDAFVVSDAVIEEFETTSGIEVTFFTGADAGSMVSEAILTVDNPLADVMFGVDNTFLSRALAAGVFEPYRSPELDRVPTAFQLDPDARVTPVDYGDVCLNVWTDRFAPGQAPTSLADLIDPAYEGALVTPNPETSSPGLALLLATVATYGDPGWEDYWIRLRDNGVRVTSGWTEAYYGDFVAGGGDVPVVTSYASSPVAEVIFSDPAVEVAPTVVVLDSCFRQIEFAGILTGTERRDEAEEFIDFLLSDSFQEDMPLNMFVFPVSDTAELPSEFVEHAVIPDVPLQLDPELIEAERDRWTDRWVEIVLR